MFNYSDNESLPSLKRRLMELLERMKNYEVSPTPFSIMYTFLMCAARFSNNHVQDICIDYLATVDDDTRFPLDLNSVYEELIAKADVVNQVASRNRSRQSHEGSVHQTALKNNIRSMTNNRAKGNNKGFRPKGQAFSAYSNINKSVKKKLETQTLNGKPKNEHTDAFCRDMMRKNPGMSYRDCLNSLPPCLKCKHRWHLDKDCRHQGPAPKPTQAKGPAKKSFRKKNDKRGRVNNVTGNASEGDDWVASVFCAACSPCDSSSVTTSDIKEWIDVN
jgi:hypothetical protein